MVSAPSPSRPYPMIGPWAAHRVRAGAQSRDACAAVASSRKQLVGHVVVGRSSRLNSRLNSPTGVGSMNVDKPALSTEGGGTAHIRGAEGTIILVLFVGFCGSTSTCAEVVITSRCDTVTTPYTVKFRHHSISLAEIRPRIVLRWALNCWPR